MPVGQDSVCCSHAFFESMRVSSTSRCIILPLDGLVPLLQSRLDVNVLGRQVDKIIRLQNVRDGNGSPSLARKDQE